MRKRLDRETAKTAAEILTSPNRSLRRYGQVLDQKTGMFVPFNPDNLTGFFQQRMLDYWTMPPRTDDGQTRFLFAVGPRQSGKSTLNEYAAYVKTAYRPGVDHSCIADTDNRAKYLHQRVQQLHARWPEEIRSPTRGHEVNQLSFDPLYGGKMRVMSAREAAAGIGQSPDSFHGSELPFWPDAAGVMLLIWPSLINRYEAIAVFESTPWEAGDWFHENYVAAKRLESRFCALFAPFWDGYLNRRIWREDWKMQADELEYLEKYGQAGLTKEHLAFRRFVMDTEPQIRRRPELFEVFYPFDDVSCWLLHASAAFPGHVLERHRLRKMEPWERPFKQYEGYDQRYMYVMGVDPTGYAARDHAAFHVLRVSAGEWKQVYTYAEHVDPVTFTRKAVDVAHEYGTCPIVCESNGVGQAFLALLGEWEYENIYHEAAYKPGVTATPKSLDKMTGWLIDALMDELVLQDDDTFSQLCTYKNDKRIEESPSNEMIRGEANRRRRDRHHWDKVSALLYAVAGARALPNRHVDAGPRREAVVVPYRDLPYNKMLDFRALQKQDDLANHPRLVYRSVRRRR